MDEIKQRLKELCLTGMRSTLAERNRHALDQKLTYLEFLELLLEDEQVLRAGSSYRRRLKQSKLNPQKTLETYEFSFQPELDRRLLSELASGRFLEAAQNIILMGNPGVGKTHLANALGLKALEAGRKVLMVHANELIDQLYRSRADDSYPRVMKKLLRADLLIIDELGFKAVSSQGTDDLFDIIRQRYEQRSVIITTNRDFQGWEQLLGDPVIASAIIDRLVHHGVVIKILGDSYRMSSHGEQTTENKKPKEP